jgi:hypothetical protein
MDVNTQYKGAILEFDMTQSLVGRYVGLEPSRVSRALTEEIPFNHAEARDITETIEAMRSVQTEISLPINWAQIGKVKPSVDARRKELRDQRDPIVRRCILIRTSLTGFFQRMNGANVVTTPSEMSAAAFETPDIANDAVRELKKFGTSSQIESFGAFRRRSTMTHSLIEIGFESTTLNRGTALK